MDETTERIDDLLEGEKEFGNQTFTWNGADYLCVPSQIRTIISPEIGALHVDRSLTMTVRSNQFSNGILPKGLEFIQFKGKRWTILEADSDTFDVSVRLICIEDNRGAHA